MNESEPNYKELRQKSWEAFLENSKKNLHESVGVPKERFNEPYDENWDSTKFARKMGKIVIMGVDPAVGHSEQIVSFSNGLPEVISPNIEIELLKNTIIYETGDGKKFYNKTEASIHQCQLTSLRMEWYNKRFSTWYRFRFWLNKYEPIKPYKF